MAGKLPNEDGFVYGVGWNSALLSFNWDFLAGNIPKFNKSLNDYIKQLQQKSDRCKFEVGYNT